MFLFQGYIPKEWVKSLCLVLILTFFLIISSASIPVQALDQNPEIEYGWVEYLFNQGQTMLAINAGLRFIYLYPMHKYSDDIRMLIGKSYVKEGKYDKAIESFQGISEGASRQDVREEAELWLCNSLMKRGSYSAARRRCDAFQIHHPHSHLKDRVRYIKGWSLLKEYRWIDAKVAFKEIDPNSSLFKPAQQMIKETQYLNNLKGKSAFTAGTLSLILPGSGYIYIGKWHTGIMALLVNGAFVSASIESFDNDLPILGCIIGLVGLGWYSGTVYGSVEGAKHYNYRMINNRLQHLSKGFALPFLEIEF